MLRMRPLSGRCGRISQGRGTAPECNKIPHPARAKEGSAICVRANLAAGALLSGRQSRGAAASAACGAPTPQNCCSWIEAAHGKSCPCCSAALSPLAQ